MIQDIKSKNVNHNTQIIRTGKGLFDIAVSDSEGVAVTTTDRNGLWKLKGIIDRALKQETDARIRKEVNNAN